MAPRNISIVVIDDEEVMRTACRDVLRHEGYHIETFAKPEDGLERIQRDPPDVAIVDLMMPRISGREVLCRIREMAPQVCTIVITGYATGETEEETRSCGAFGFLPKPFTPSELRTLITAALESRE